MTLRAWSWFIVATIPLIAQIHASSDISLPINNTPIYSAIAAEYSVACFRALIFDSRLADTRSCLQAAISLPSGADPGVFHNGGVDDGYRLPKVKIHGPCVATVSIRGAGVDRSSWDRISHVAGQIAAICSNGRYPRGTTGGVKYAGFGGSIRVALERAPGVELKEGGNTDSSAIS